MANYDQKYNTKQFGDLVYYVQDQIKKPRKKEPPFMIVMNESCTQCSGGSMCVTECPVDCIHPINDDRGRPVRVYVDNDVCIGCMNCFSYEVRAKHIMADGDKEANMKKYNGMDLYSKQGVCPWDAIEVHEYKAGIDRSKLFYLQPNHANPGDELDIEQSDEEATEGDESSVSDNELIEA